MNLKKIAFSILAAFSISQAYASDFHDVEQEGGSFQVSAQASMDICANDPIPAGWIVTNIYPGCGTGTGRYQIEQLNTNFNEMFMCAVTPVPAGWVVGSVQVGCGLAGYGRLRLVPVRTSYVSMTMCNVPTAQIPPNWVVTSVSQGCGLPGLGQYTIQYANPSYLNMKMCAFSPVPPGWMVVSSEAGCGLPGMAGVRWIRYVG
ncbi:hypothetical protein [Delftia acidovorans]|uniref:hypothetical protein n=1 Tax=Delftia acidovorans TaxID=80866 RepID=UPI001C0AA452|nr:hypothetical protein [Delftia acidovorans]